MIKQRCFHLDRESSVHRVCIRQPGGEGMNCIWSRAEATDPPTHSAKTNITAVGSPASRRLLMPTQRCSTPCFCFAASHAIRSCCFMAQGPGIRLTLHSIAKQPASLISIYLHFQALPCRRNKKASGIHLGFTFWLSRAPFRSPPGPVSDPTTPQHQLN